MDTQYSRALPSIRSENGVSTSSSNHYSTTPSTFPQPVFQPPMDGTHEPVHSAELLPHTLPSPGLVPTDSFAANTSPSSYIAQPRSAASGFNEETQTGLVHQQLSSEHLAGEAGDSQASAARERPRRMVSSTADYEAVLAPERMSIDSVEVFATAPERDPDRYGATASHNQRKCTRLSADFFVDSVKRVRERNQRQSDVDKRMREPNTSQERRMQIWSSAGRKEGRFLRFLRTKDRPENYHTIKVIGKGAFGEVKLVQKKTDGRVYAMKSLIKTEMLQGDHLAHVRSERDILAEAETPWVVKLYTTFQDAYFLYMLMEFLPGGDLMTMLIKYEIFSEDITRFYMAECILAIEAVHELGFIHRDIKPDNILLDRAGHVKLTDFGLSTGFNRLHDKSYYQQLLQKKPTSPPRDRSSVAIDQINLTVSNRPQINEWRRSRRLMAYSAVGTPDYTAPEIIIGQGYSFGCDWWSLGAIMFECLVGWPPFCAEHRHDVYRKIVNWRQSLYFPDDIMLSQEAEGLIRSLICNPQDRVGREGAQELKAQPFFRGVEFDGLRRIRAPFEPRLTSNTDTTYFPTDEIDQTGAAELLKAQRGLQGLDQEPEESLEMSLPFIGYTFKRFDSNFW